MKKLICILLAVLMLTACGANSQSNKPADTNRYGKILGEEVTFQPWEQEGLPAEGCYYLTKDVELTEQVQVTGQLKLHLNGHTVKGAESVIFGNLFVVPAGGELVIYDAAEGTGTVASPRAYNANQTVTSMFLVGGTVTVAGGHIDASGISVEDVCNGSSFFVENGGVLNISGGTVTGGTSWCTVTTPEEGEPTGRGGSIYVAPGGLFNLSGGTLENGSGGLGGNVYVAKDAEDPQLVGRMVMTGGTITGGESVFSGGNVYVVGEMEMSAGLITLGSAYKNGGNLAVSGKFIMTGGTVSEGRCDANDQGGKRGGNMMVSGAEAIIHISNAEFLDGDASGSENHGGNIAVYSKGAREFTITDSVLTGGMGHRAGNLYIGSLSNDIDPENLDYTLTNVTISEGAVSYRGTTICVDTKNEEKPILLTLNNCDLIAVENSPSVNLAIGAGAADNTLCHVVMNGGSIQNGSLSIYGNGSLTTYGTATTMETYANGGQWIKDPAE